MLGPIDYIIIGFRGNRFDGSIINELSTAVQDGIVRVVDLIFIVKDAQGNVDCGEIEDQPLELKQALGDVTVAPGLPLLADSDIKQVAQDMDNDTAAGVLVVEHVWAKGLKQALIDAGGFLIADGRIHPEEIETAVRELKLEHAV